MAGDIFLTTYVKISTPNEITMYTLSYTQKLIEKNPKQIKQTEQINQNHTSSSLGKVNNFINSKTYNGNELCQTKICAWNGQNW